MGVNRVSSAGRDRIVKMSAFPRNLSGASGVNCGMSVLPTPGQTLVRIVTLAVATTVAAFMLFASLLIG
jgi:hypothetical protein